MRKTGLSLTPDDNVSDLPFLKKLLESKQVTETFINVSLPGCMHIPEKLCIKLESYSYYQVAQYDS